jgi:hypothetical protein
MLSFTTVLLASLVGSAFSAAVDPNELVTELRDAPTAVDRVNLLPNDSQVYPNSVIHLLDFY